MIDRKAERQARMTIRRYASAAEAARDELAYWRGLPDGERVLQVWRLSEEQWRLRGEWNDESRLCRSVTRLSRR